jgi:hypothetical protein
MVTDFDLFFLKFNDQRFDRHLFFLIIFLLRDNNMDKLDWQIDIE